MPLPLGEPAFFCEPHFEEVPFQNFQSHSFDTTWDLTPPESPARGANEECYNENDYTRVTVNLDQRVFSPYHDDLASIMWTNEEGAFELRGDWTAPPSPVAFDELTDINNEIESYTAFELEQEAALLVNSLTQVESTPIPFMEPIHVPLKRKSSASNASTVGKLVSKSKAPSSPTKSALARIRPPRRVESSPTPELESDDPESKRHTHNVLERKRRNELKSSYQELREEIPDLYDNDKTPTGVILNRACEYIAALQEEEAMLLQNLMVARMEHARLRKLFAA